MPNGKEAIATAYSAIIVLNLATSFILLIVNDYVLVPQTKEPVLSV